MRIQSNPISHFPTLWQAFDSLYEKANALKIESNELENYMHTGGIVSGFGWAHSFEIDKLKGRNTKKAFQVVIHKLETSYELVSYVL